MSEDAGFLLDRESLAVLQRLVDLANLKGENLVPSLKANPAISIYVKVINRRVSDDGFGQLYNGFQVVWDVNEENWVYKKGGVIFGTSITTSDKAEFDGPRLDILTVFNIDPSNEIPELEEDGIYAAYPTYTTGKDSVSKIIYVIDSTGQQDVVPGCHLEFSVEDGDLDVTVITLLGGNTTDPEDPMIKSIYLDFFDGPDNDGTFPCLFLDLNCETLVADLAGDGLKVQTPPVVDEPCKIQIEIDDSSCDALFVDEFGLSFDAEPVAGQGLRNLFDCQLDVFIDPDCDTLDFDLVTDGLFIDIVALAGPGLKEGVVDECKIQLGIDTLPETDLSTRDQFAFFNEDTGIHEKSKFRDAPFYVTLDNQLLAHRGNEDFNWITADEAINLTDQTINVLHRFSIDRDVPTNSLEFVNDVDIPGNNFFYGTDDAGIKNWIDFDTLAGSGLSFGTDFSVDVKNSIEIDVGELQLVGDEAIVAAKKYYGTAAAVGPAGLGYHEGEAITVVQDIVSLVVSGTTVTINFKTVDLKVLDNGGTPADDTALGSGGECTT